MNAVCHSLGKIFSKIFLFCCHKVLCFNTQLNFSQRYHYTAAALVFGFCVVDKVVLLSLKEILIYRILYFSIPMFTFQEYQFNQHLCSLSKDMRELGGTEHPNCVQVLWLLGSFRSFSFLYLSLKKGQSSQEMMGFLTVFLKVCPAKQIMKAVLLLHEANVAKQASMVVQ